MSCSIARQNRRMRLKQLAAVPLSNSKPQILSAQKLKNQIPSSPSNECESSENGHKNGQEIFDSLKDTLSSVDSQETLASATGCSFVNCDLSSRPLGKVFVEEERGFKAIDSTQNFESSNIQFSKQNEFGEVYAIDLALKVASYFHSFSNFCHGLLGGMSLLYILVLTHFISDPITEETIRHFSFLSQPVHNIFNFLCIVCCISVFDRYDIGNPKQLLKQIQQCNLKLIILAIYPISLILSLSTANVDERFCIPEKNATILESLQFKETDHEFFYWKTLSLSKCCGTLFGWVILALDPYNNLLNKDLENIVQMKKSSLH